MFCNYLTYFPWNKEQSKKTPRSPDYHHAKNRAFATCPNLLLVACEVSHTYPSPFFLVISSPSCTCTPPRCLSPSPSLQKWGLITSHSAIDAIPCLSVASLPGVGVMYFMDKCEYGLLVSDVGSDSGSFESGGRDERRASYSYPYDSVHA